MGARRLEIYINVRLPPFLSGKPYYTFLESQFLQIEFVDRRLWSVVRRLLQAPYNIVSLCTWAIKSAFKSRGAVAVATVAPFRGLYPQGLASVA